MTATNCSLLQKKLSTAAILVTTIVWSASSTAMTASCGKLWNYPMTVAQWSASEANFYETTTFYSTFYAPAGGNNSARTVIDTKDAPNNAIVHFVASVGGGTPTPGQWVVSGEADQYTILVIDGINPITKKIPNPAGDNCHANPVIQ